LIAEILYRQEGGVEDVLLWRVSESADQRVARVPRREETRAMGRPTTLK
jgi:hypothetical protein